MKTSIIFVLATLLLSAYCTPHVFSQHDIITYPPSETDRPTKVRTFSDEEYNRWCTPRTGKRTNIFNSKLYLVGLDSTTLFQNSELELAWKGAVSCGRYQGYDHRDIGKVWSKALTNAANISNVPISLGLVSAAVNHITGIYSCANYEATADLLFTLADPEGRKRDSHMFTKMAEQFVNTQVSNFEAARDCKHYSPKVLPGIFNEKFDCSAPFIPSSSMALDAGEDQKPNAALEEFIQHAKKSFESCGKSENQYLSHDSENYKWKSYFYFQYIEIDYFDAATKTEYNIYVDKDFNRGNILIKNIVTEEESFKVFAQTEY